MRIYFVSILLEAITEVDWMKSTGVIRFNPFCWHGQLFETPFRFWGVYAGGVLGDDFAMMCLATASALSWRMLLRVAVVQKA